MLTCLGFLFEGGALGYQVYLSLIGINVDQQVVTVCNNEINTILSNSNLFFLVSFIGAALACLCLAAMVGLLAGGCCSWRGRQIDYVDQGPQGQADGDPSRVNEQAKDFMDEYFTYRKLVLGTVVYTFAMVGSLAHFGLMATIMVSYIVCTGILFVNLLVITILGGLAFFLTIICFVKWQLIRCKLKAL